MGAIDVPPKGSKARQVELEQLQGSELDGGRFRLEKLLGQGGYGAVFRAVQTSMGRPCALKVLHAKFIEADNVIDRFRAEARATSSLRHPNTVVIYDYGHDEALGLFYIAMEFLEGMSLDGMIKHHKRLELDVAMKLIDQIARSLQDAHDKAIVHRDIKPHNIMVVRQAGEPYFVKVIDFGIAKITHGDNLFEGTRELHLTQTGTMIGTPLYMAPEQIREGGQVDGRTDMYALGMCLYKMLLGHTPYQGMETWEVIGKHMAGPPKPLRYYDPKLQVSDDFERVVLRALQREKQDRYPSILEFARALQAVCERDGLLGSTTPAQHDTMLLPQIDATTPMPSRRNDGLPVGRIHDVPEAYDATQVPIEPRGATPVTAKNRRDGPQFKTSRTESIAGGVQPHILGKASEGETVAGVLTPASPEPKPAPKPDETAGVAQPSAQPKDDDRLAPVGTVEQYREAPARSRMPLLLSGLVVSGLILLGVVGIAVTSSLKDQPESEPPPVEFIASTPRDEAPQKPEESARVPPTGELVAGSVELARGRTTRAMNLATQAIKNSIPTPPTARVVNTKVKVKATTPPKTKPKPEPIKEAKSVVKASTQSTDFVVIPYGDLYVDGKKISGTGKRVVKLTPGDHEAYVIKDGKKSSVKRFTVTDGKRGRVQFKVFNL